MRSSRLGLVLVLLLVLAPQAFAQVPAAPAVEPAPAAEPVPAPEPMPPPPTPPPAPEPPVVPTPESAPASDKTPETAPAVEPAPAPAPLGRAPVVGSDAPQPAPAAPPWVRAHQALTLEGRLGMLLRPESAGGFQDETHVGADLGLSLYLDLNRELAAGVEIERASLGRGTALSGLDSASIDYTVSSAMLGFRAYPKRSELFDVYVGVQLGVGIQGVSAAGTQSNGALLPPSPYTCGASDAPALQLGGGVGARLMLSPRWGVSARINGTGRRLSGEVIDECAQGLGTATTVSGSLGLGYDFDLEP